METSERKITFYTKKGCIACNRVKYLLDKLEIPHETIYDDKENRIDITKFPRLTFGEEEFKNPISVADLYYIKVTLDKEKEEKENLTKAK